MAKLYVICGEGSLSVFGLCPFSSPRTAAALRGSDRTSSRPCASRRPPARPALLMLTTLAVTLLAGASALHTPSRPLGRRAAIGTAAAASFLPVAAAFAVDNEASLIAEIKEIRAKLDGAVPLLCPCALPPSLRRHTALAPAAAPARRFCPELTLAVPPVEQCLRSTSCSRRSSGTRSAPSSKRRLSTWRARCALNAPARQRPHSRHHGLLSAGSTAGTAGSGWRSALRTSSSAALSRMRSRVAQQM